MRKQLYVIMAAVVVVLGAYMVLFTVDETEYATVTTFGKPVDIIKEPGLYKKWPAPVQSVISFDKRVQLFDPRPTENFTLDKKNLVVDSYACWRINEPDKFLEKVQTIQGAEDSLAVLMMSQLGAQLGRHELSAIVSVDEEEVKLDDIMRTVTEECRKIAMADYGIEVLDVRIKRVNLPEENKQSVYRRMRAEREQKAKQYRAEGEQQAMVVRAETDRKQREILSEAYKKAQKIKGEGEAQAYRLYAGAYKKDNEFFKFMRTLRAYEEILTEETTLVMSSESEFLKLISDFDPEEFFSESKRTISKSEEIHTGEQPGTTTEPVVERTLPMPRGITGQLPEAVEERSNPGGGSAVQSSEDNAE